MGSDRLSWWWSREYCSVPGRCVPLLRNYWSRNHSIWFLEEWGDFNFRIGNRPFSLCELINSFWWPEMELLRTITRGLTGGWLFRLIRLWRNLAVTKTTRKRKVGQRFDSAFLWAREIPLVSCFDLVFPIGLIAVILLRTTMSSKTSPQALLGCLLWRIDNRT